MKKDGNEALRGYLETGKTPEVATAVAQDAGFMVAATVQSDPMKELMQNMAAVCMAAKDLHYKAKGKPFLANHELADMIAGLDKNRDSLNEIYYMGEKQTNPPISYEIVGGAASLVQTNYGGNPSPEEDALLGVLHSLCAKVSDQVEQIKQVGGIKSGTQAVLDEISKDALQYAGFLKNVLNGMGTKTDADAEAETVTDGPEVEAKGVVVAQPEETPVAENGEEDDAEAIAAAEEDDEEEKTPAERYMGLVNKRFTSKT